MKNIILASSSPRRIEIMKKNGYDPIIMPPEVDETLPRDIGMRDSVMYLALKKALSVESALLGFDFGGTPAYLPENPIIIAADTIVYKDGIIGKPIDKQHAFEILAYLRGEPHFVATGVAMIKAGQPIRKVFCEVTKVFFKEYTDEEILDYINTDEPYDKAGAYAIQGTFGKYIHHIDGELDNVIGFPWSKIQENLDLF